MASPMSKESRSMSTAGESLYALLNVPKDAKEDDIKKAYRKLALRLHPDKNRDDPLATEKFKEVNRAHKVLSDEKKRQIYDEYGSFGIYIADQIGEDNVDLYFLVNSKCFRITSVICFFCTCYCFCFCCCLCCFGCCGRCRRGEEDDEDFEIVIPDDEEEGEEGNETTPVTSQPKSEGGASNAPIAMPPPPEKSAADEPTETTGLNTGEKPLYTEG
ncbi:dnaJ homolog subfamily C member 5-like [Diadema setosum]|uniref:dnaJ homolog subfamily C member 5-like n=1 Tax=Diadema setosum TaxID=31175 RepID=UPI003B3B31EE